MTIALRPILALDPTLVAANQAELVQRVQEDKPTLDVRIGPVLDLIVRLSAALATQRQQQQADYLHARSFLDITKEPALADTDTVDALVSNFLLSRELGAPARGTVTLVYTKNTTATIGQGTLFTAGNATFTADKTYTGKALAGQVLADTDLLFRTLPNGNFAIDIQVTATADGAAGNLTRGTTLIPAKATALFVVAYAAEDFTGGINDESNAQLMDRLMAGAAARTVSNRLTMAAMLRATPGFTRVVNDSIVGYGDAEMLRDKHWLWPVSGGGRVDWYVRTTEQVTDTLLQGVTARLIAKVGGFGTWQFGFDRNKAPGFYEIVSIVPAGAGSVDSFAISSEVRGVDLHQTNERYLIPDIESLVEGAYSRFQTVVVQFDDTATLTAALAIGATNLYDVVVRGLPQIDAVQDMFASRDYASYGADLLVRAPVPCFTTLVFTLFRPTNLGTLDIAAVKTAVCAAVNQTGFTGALHASTITAAIHGVVASTVGVSAIAMHGRVRRPDGSTVLLSDTSVLTVPEEPTLAVTRKTVQFFLRPDDVTITVTDVPPASN